MGATAKSVQVSQLRKLRECEQVAAVCYRMGNEGIEFLLVQTRGGRWTFPKGHVEPGLTHAQAAALEAFEEAGVHGRMQEVSFTSYRRGPEKKTKSAKKPTAIYAHLCEVLRLGAPEESKRNPTWFTAEKAKRRLCKERTPKYGLELARVVDRAVKCIQQMPRESGEVLPPARTDPTQKDALQKVRFEAMEVVGMQGLMQEAAFIRYTRFNNGLQSHAAVDAYLYRTLRTRTPHAAPPMKSVKQLHSGNARRKMPFLVVGSRREAFQAQASRNLKPEQKS